MDLKTRSLYDAPYYGFILRNFPSIIALVLLALASYYLILHRPDNANRVAEYAFYVFVISVMYKIAQTVIYNCYLKREGTSLES
jgi:hypothetical protein